MKNRLVAIVVAALVAGSFVFAQGPTKYGKPLTLKETTKISDILSQPDKYNGKRVRVEGTVADVCSMAGCWIAIAGDKESQAIRFKVDDGVIVFPMTAKGLRAVAEGVVSVSLLSEADQIKQGEMEAKEHNKTFDPKTVKGPKTDVQLKGEGAEIY